MSKESNIAGHNNVKPSMTGRVTNLASCAFFPKKLKDMAIFYF